VSHPPNTPPRPLEEIEADIRAIEADIVRMLAKLTGGPASEINVDARAQAQMFSVKERSAEP
jgi:hypothetical protein